VKIRSIRVCFSFFFFFFFLGAQLAQLYNRKLLEIRLQVLFIKEICLIRITSKSRGEMCCINRTVDT